MAIYHCHVQIISRSSGRSSVAAAAYRSGTRITDERTGVVHDYTRKGGVVHTEIVSPDNAPARWRDRSTLWNEVERTERSANAQLAREIEYALPRELTRDEQIALAREYAETFAREGMVVDFAIHDKNEPNVHCHMLLSTRPCCASGFTAKGVKEYLMRNPKNGKERYMTAAELKASNGDWKKVYRYKDGIERTQAEAEAAGLHPTKDRKSKAPIQRKRDLTDWNNKEKVTEWRIRLADITNAHLAAAGSRERVDHRSNAERGIQALPTIHEGYAVRRVEAAAKAAAERDGREYRPVTERRRHNMSIARFNDWLRATYTKAKRSLASLRSELAAAARRGRDPTRPEAHKRLAITVAHSGGDGAARMGGTLGSPWGATARRVPTEQPQKEKQHTPTIGD